MPHDTSRRRLLGAAAAGAAAVSAAAIVPAHADTPATAPSTAAASARRFAGKVVLITGATSGIGEATARAFAREGAKVGFCGRRTSLGRAVERSIRADGGDATYVRADVREPDQVKRFVDTVAKKYDGLDIAVNNAGITLTAPAHELTLEQWTDVQNTNARGVFLSVKYEIPHLIAGDGGVIICTSSGSVRPAGAAYTASKHAIDGIVETAAMDYGTRGIRINAIHPGTTDTAFVRPDGIPDKTWEEFKKAWGPLNVAGMERMATPQEIARAILALATEEFSYQTGSIVHVGGGPAAGGKMHMPPGFPTP